MKLGIYIHWPFCLSKCPYCDFFSQVRKDINQEDIIKEYLSDLDFYQEMTPQREVSSIFFGGGTPSLIQPQNIEKIINHIGKNWQLSSNAEISLEANPNTQTPTLFADLKSSGINRLSLGVQALSDCDLNFFGRTHNAVEAKKAMETVVKTFDNHSMDLIYARPNQNLENWQVELAQATDFGFKHLSMYQLTIEEGTVFYKKQIEALEENLAAEMYLKTEEILATKGYNKYEVSNYAKPNFESQHNLLYWQGDDYIGVGKSAHGRIGLNATEHKRQITNLIPSERAQELVIMGLRLTQGIDKNKFKAVCGLDFDKFINQKKRQELEEQSLIINSHSHIAPTKQGFLLLNKIIEELLS